MVVARETEGSTVKGVERWRPCRVELHHLRRDASVTSHRGQGSGVKGQGSRSGAEPHQGVATARSSLRKPLSLIQLSLRNLVLEQRAESRWGQYT